MYWVGHLISVIAIALLKVIRGIITEMGSLYKTDLREASPVNGSKNRFFFIEFFNRITIQKVNAKVLNRLDEKWENERQKGWAPFAKIDGFSKLNAFFSKPCFSNWRAR